MAGRINQCRVIHIAVEGRIRTTHWIHNNQVDVLRLQLCQTILDVILGFCRKTDQNLAVLMAAEFFENI